MPPNAATAAWLTERAPSEAEMADLAEGAELSGHVAFTLHDTYGFPYEVTAEIAEDRSHPVDRATFPSDVLSGHTIQPAGVAAQAALHRQHALEADVPGQPGGGHVVVGDGGQGRGCGDRREAVVGPFLVEEGGEVALGGVDLRRRYLRARAAGGDPRPPAGCGTVFDEQAPF